ncbi:MAG: hypothetical protein ACJA2G_002218 [Cognaticolwellia sp.]|jgi:hypothetical protein
MNLSCFIALSYKWLRMAIGLRTNLTFNSYFKQLTFDEYLFQCLRIIPNLTGFMMKRTASYLVSLADFFFALA